MGKNKKNIAFIHLSDIHISDFTERNGNKILSRFSQYRNYSNVFVENLDKFLKKNNLELKCVNISGDLANSSEPEEYEKVKEFLNTIKEKFSLDTTDILMTPGNHDINWYLNEHAYRENSKKGIEKKMFEYHNEKFENFKTFYDSFYNNKSFVFNPELACSIIKGYQDLKLCFIGLNSNYKESFDGNDHYGYINEISLDSELQEIIKKYAGYKFIVFFHHNPTTQREKDSITLKNWGDIYTILEKHKILNILYGHTHANESKKIINYVGFGYFGIGSFGKKEKSNSFNLFVQEFINDNQAKFKRLLFKFMEEDSYLYQDTGYWEKQENIKDLDELNISLETGFKPLVKEEKSSQNIMFPLSKPFISNTSFEEDEEELSNEDLLLDILKSDNLVKSGHFHWSQNRKTRTWIDINLLLGSKKTLQIIRNEFISIIKNLSTNIDLIVGLGIEGNVIASPLSVVFNSYYSYFPLPTRTDHNEFEKELIKGEFKNIVLITDVIFEGNTVKEFIENQTEFFKDSEKIILLSIFYTGKEEYNLSLFESTIDKRVIFNCITDKIKLEKCTLDIARCEVCQSKLDFIYNF